MIAMKVNLRDADGILESIFLGIQSLYISVLR